MPAWRLIDPLPVLAQLGESGSEDEGDSLEELIRKGAEVAEAKREIKHVEQEVESQ